ncbi:MAG: S8 family serine peptidase, partial [Lachnospiraceae bacterium]|nr:S8 family serine peptidase [Lachnospiraceae bacterium]
MKNYIARALSIIMSIIICISFTFGGNAMAIAETISGDASSDASSNAMLVATDFNNDVYTFKDKGVKVLVVKKNSWNDGYVADISIENTGSEPLSNWHIDLKVKGDIDSVWNSEYEVKDGKLTLSYPTWKRKINAGEIYTVGMKVNGTFGDFEDFSYYEDAKDVSDLYKIEYKVRNTWPHHAIIDAVITNTGDTTLRDWSLAMDYDADIIDMWNADVVSNEGGSYRLKCKDYNADIEPDESVTFGFQAVYEGDEVVLPANSKLYAVADSKLVPVETDRVDWYKTISKADSEEAIRMRDSVKDVVKVAIIDSGVDYFGEGDEINRVDFIHDTDEENPLYDDRSGHGTGVGGMLVGVGKKAEEEEETTEAEPADVDFSYLTDADYIEAVDVEEDEQDTDDDLTDEDDCSDYDNDDYEDYDVEDYDEESYDEDEDLDNDVIDASDDADETYEDSDNDLNLFEYNDLYGDIEGLNPNIDLTSLRVLDENNEAPVSRVIEAIEWAIDNGINILNLSWGTNVDSPELHKVIKRAYNKGMLIIAAAGNDGTVSYPAKYDEVIAVGSVDSMAKIASDSASGDGIELVAPAEDVIAYTSFGILTFTSGTSFAAPQVTALASILWQQDISVSNKCIRELLRQSASPFGDTDCYGYGVIDYEKAAGMYEDFVNNYVEENVYDSEDACIDEVDKVPTVYEEYVKGLWANHYKMLSKKNQEIEFIKLGIDWPDNANSGLKGMTDNPEFHGGIKFPGDSLNAEDFEEEYISPKKKSKKAHVNGYLISVDGYLEMMLMAYNMENDGKLLNKKKSMDSQRLSKRIVRKVKQAIVAKYEGEPWFKKHLNNKGEIKRITDSGEKQIIRNFIVGMALHTLGDYYAHQTYGLIEPCDYYTSVKKIKENNKTVSKRIVKNIDTKYVRITHGISGDGLSKLLSIDASSNGSSNVSSNAERQNILDRLLYLKNKNGGKNPAFFDNRADNRYISKNRYEYTKKIYSELIRDRLKKEGLGLVSSKDYIYSSSSDGIKSINEFSSLNLYDRVNYMEDRFVMDTIDNDLNLPSSDAMVNRINSENVYNEYKKWQKVNIVLPKDISGDASMKIWKVAFGQGIFGIPKPVGVVNTEDKSTYAYEEDDSKRVYSFIGDTNSKYLINVTVSQDATKMISYRLFTVKPNELSEYEKDDDTFTVHCGKDGNKKGYDFEYNTKMTEKKLKYINVLDEKEVALDLKEFFKVSLTGSVSGQGYGRKTALSNAEVKIWEANNPKKCLYAYTSKKGAFTFDKNLYPGLYCYTVTKAGYNSISGQILINEDPVNQLGNIYLDEEVPICKNISGYVTDLTNNYSVRDIKIEVYKGDNTEQQPCATAFTDMRGQYVIKELPEGTYTFVVKDEREAVNEEKYVTFSKSVTVKQKNKSDVYDMEIAKELKPNQLRIVLDWNSGPNDLDAHIKWETPDGYGGDCYYDNEVHRYNGEVVVHL